MQGWNKLRDTIFANQKKLGVIPQNAKLTPWPKDLLKDWDQLTADEKKMFIRQVDVFAAYVAYTDHEIGRVIQAVEDMGKLDNTLIIYINGDNGTSAEGTLLGHAERGRDVQRRRGFGRRPAQVFYDVWGSDKTYNHMAVPWAWAFDTPFSWTKQIASHFGGVKQGMAISWPAVITGQGRHARPVPPRHRHRADDPRGREYQAAQSGRRHQAKPDRRRQHGLHVRHEEREGAVDAQDAVLRDDGRPCDLPRRLDREHQGHAAAVGHMRRRRLGSRERIRGSSTTSRNDWTQSDDVAAKYPAKSRRSRTCSGRRRRSTRCFRSIRPWRRASSRRGPASPPGRNVFTWTAPLTGTPNGDAPCILNTSYNFKAEIEVPQGGGEGMLITQGGRFAGYGFYLLKGKPVFNWNLVGLKRVQVGRADALSPGKHTLEFDFKYDGLGMGTLAFNNMSGIGRGGTGVLKVDGKVVASRRWSNASVHPAVGRKPRRRLRHRYAAWTTRTTRCRSSSPASSTRSRSTIDRPKLRRKTRRS